MADINPTQLSFDEAIEYFSKKTSLDTDSWVEGQGITQDSFFTVAAAKGHLLQDLRDAVAKAQAEGKSTADFLKVFDRIADSYSPDWMKGGNRAWRGQLIYEQNINQAHKAGRYQQLMEPTTKKLRPYWQWRHGNSRDPRPSHIALDGKVFPCDKLPMFNHGFNCRCQIFSLSSRDLERKGLEISDLKRGDYVKSIDPSTGEAVAVKLEPDKGFDYTPGKSTKQQRDAILKGLSPDLRKSVMGESEAEFKLAPGSTRRRNGVNYILTNSRWHRADDQSNPERLRIKRSSDIAKLTNRFRDEMENPVYGADGKLLTYEDVAEKFLHNLMQFGDRDKAETAAAKIDMSGVTDKKGTLNNAIDFYQLIDKDLGVEKIHAQTERAYAIEKSSEIAIPDNRTAKYRRSTQFHEMAHFAEFRDPQVAIDAKKWIRSRATGELDYLNRITNLPFDNNELAYPDNFIHPYVGKSYLTNSTEALSMGLEVFSNPKTLVDLYRSDSEHFNLIMGYIRK